MLLRLSFSIAFFTRTPEEKKAILGLNWALNNSKHYNESDSAQVVQFMHLSRRPENYHQGEDRLHPGAYLYHAGLKAQVIKFRKKLWNSRETSKAEFQTLILFTQPNYRALLKNPY